MPKDGAVKGRRKWWNSLSKEEKFKRMQALSKKRWEKMTPAQRAAHGRRMAEIHKARFRKKKKLQNS